MTAPTQAQIEAIRQLIVDYEDRLDETDAYEHGVINRAKEALAVLTAAAQVGEHTIERCAQVCERFEHNHPRQIAAAIRELKDAP